MNHLRKLLENQLEIQRTNEGLTWDEAYRRVRDEYSVMNGASEALEAMAEERRQQQEERLIEISPSQVVDQQAATWYLGPVEGHSPLGDRLKSIMETRGLAGAFHSIDDHSTRIVERLAEPAARRDKRRGLVIGHVQSGKTANYAAVIAKAVDAGYKLVIVLAGVLNNLRYQTQARLDQDLSVEALQWTALTGLEGEFGPEKHPLQLVEGSGRLLAVTKKNSTRLGHIENFLRDLPQDFRERLPILIIDDEADQATPDSAAKLNEMSRIHSQLRRIWSLVGNGSYVSYTATPFANLFMEPNDEESLYPRNFIHVLPEPEGYFGARRIFGLDEGVDDGDFNGTEVDVVRPIPDEDRDQVVPPSQRRGAEIEEFEASVPPSMESAILWFLLATAIRRRRGQTDKHSSMLVHTTSRVDPHFSQQVAIQDYLHGLRKKTFEFEEWGAFRDLYASELSRASELRDREIDQFSFAELLPTLRSVLTDVIVIVDNGSEQAERRLNYPDDRPITAIVVGGGTLSRGLTLEGLFVSYFARNSNTYDTLLQMGRWFGFRKGYEDLQRIWLSSGLSGDYRHLAAVEAEIRREIEQMAKAGNTPADVGIRVREHPGRLQITSRAKMKHTKDLRVGFEGRRDQTHLFDVRPEVLRRNMAYGRSLLDAARDSAEKLQPTASSAILYQGVPFQVVRDFLDNFEVHPFHGLLHDGTVLRWLEEWDEQVKAGQLRGPHQENLWNVVLSSGMSTSRDSRDWEHDGLRVRKTRRAAIKREHAPTTAQSEDARSIRALMSAGDHLADIRILSRANAPGFEQMRTEDLKDDETRRLRREHVGGRGLLVLYVIDRNSQPLDTQKLREPLATEEDVLGYGLIAPVNPEALTFDHQVLVGVEPSPPSAIEEEEEAAEIQEIPEDTEADYRRES